MITQEQKKFPFLSGSSSTFFLNIVQTLTSPLESERFIHCKCSLTFISMFGMMQDEWEL